VNSRYEHLSREELLRLVEARDLRDATRFGLVWEANEIERDKAGKWEGNRSISPLGRLSRMRNQMPHANLREYLQNWTDVLVTLEGRRWCRPMTSWSSVIPSGYKSAVAGFPNVTRSC
jgi:hypothetical protein